MRGRRLTAFLFSPAGEHWLSCLRIGLGVQLLLFSLSLVRDWQFFLGSPGQALISRQLSEALVSTESAFIPRIGWLLNVASALGVAERVALSGLWVLLLLASLLLVAGLFCRTSAIAGWFLHLCVTKSGGLLSYGVDNFMTIGLFYLMLAPLPDAWALDRRIWPRKPPDPEMLGFFRRVLQIHLCIIYFFSGLTKALGSGWWNGVNIWRALTRPPFDILPPEMLAAWRHFLPALGISVWVLELGYVVMIWPQRTRRIWLTLICLLHLGIGLTMGMWLFALVMIVLNIAAFGPAPAMRDCSANGSR